MELIDVLRRRTGFPLDQVCANCSQPFYNRDGNPVCGGCQDDPYALRSIALRLQRGALLHLLRVRCSWPEWEPEPDPQECLAASHSGAQTRRTRAAPNGREPTR